MSRFVRAGLLVAGLSGLGVSSAAALDVTGTSVNYCLNLGAFTSCASASITVAGSTLTAVVRNLSDQAPSTLQYARLLEFGFFYLDADPTGGTATFASEDLPTTWVGNTDQLSASLNATPWLGNVGSFIGGASVSAGSAWNDFSLGLGKTGTFVFSLGGSTDWSKVHFGWVGRDLANGVMYAKCLEGAEYRRTLSAGQCGVIPGIDVPPTVVPEPASMFLLATGLLALSGAGFFRRRRGSIR